MKKLLKRRSKKVGAPPGSLIYTGEHAPGKTTISLFIYDADSIMEKHPKTIEEALKLCQTDKKIWLHIAGIHDPHLISAAGKYFKLHLLLLEDIMSPTQRSKLDDYKDHLYIALHMLQIANETVETEQLSMVIGERVLLSFSEKPSDFFRPIQERINKPGSKMRQRGTDYLAYTLLDFIVDSYFVILEHVDAKLENLEMDLLNGANSRIMFKIQTAKKELVLLRKTIWPMREMINNFRHMDSPLIQETTRVYAYDVYDHTVQAIETVESFRDLAAGMHDIHVATINQKMNETIRVLTVVSTIFVPLTFITSLYGMNFDHMPELHYSWGYPVVVFVMALIAVGMLLIFRKKEWL